MKNSLQSPGFYYDERLDDKIDAKTILYDSLSSLNKKHASVYLGREREGITVKELAKKYDYTIGSTKVTISNAGKKIESLPRDSDEYQFIKYLCEI